MLSSLKIENAAVIEKAELDFTDGFTVLTGETGAGKSIIIDSINAVLGERTSRELVRTGEKQAVFYAEFTLLPDAVLQVAQELGIECSDGTLVIKRTVSADGKSSCRVNGAPVSVSMLRTLGSRLINIHGQHDSQSLLNSEEHYKFLDMLADNGELLESYRKSYRELREYEKRAAALTKSESEREQKLDFLRFQIRELTNASLRPGEMLELTQLKKRYKDSEQIAGLLRAVHDLLDGDGESQGAVSLLYGCTDCLTKLKAYYPDLAQYAENISELIYTLEECLGSVTDCENENEPEETDIDSIEERLDLLWRLSRKYSLDEEGLLEKLSLLEQEEQTLLNADEELYEIQTLLEKKRKEVYSLSERLTESRLQAGKRFSQAVTGHLHSLDMPEAKFFVRREDAPIGRDGADSIRFMITANPGEEPKELAKIASGGELSRIMLAIKSVTAGYDGIGTMIFDEIDSGVSGSAAEKMAQKLTSIARDGRQVICVSHLAKLACYASTHYYISKSVQGERTVTTVERIEGSRREQEIARIIGGNTLTETALENAREMLSMARNL